MSGHRLRLLRGRARKIFWHGCKDDAVGVFKDERFHTTRIWDAPDDKWFVTGGICFDLSKIEECLNEAMDIDGDVLQTLESEARNGTSEESLLIDRDNTLIGDDPEVEVVVGPNTKKGNEDNEKPCAQEKRDSTAAEMDLRKELLDSIRRCKGDEQYKRKQTKGDNARDLAEKDKPVLAYSLQNILVLFEFNKFSRHMIAGAMSVKQTMPPMTYESIKR